MLDKKRGITAEGLVETLKGDPLIDQRIRIPDGAPVWEIERILAGGVNLKQDAAALYDDSRVRAVDMHETDLDGNVLIQR